MTVRPCHNVISSCPCSDLPIRNISAEGPDPADHFAFSFSAQEPQLGDPDLRWGDTTFLGGCYSPVSQQEADDCARRDGDQHIFNSWGPPNGPAFPFFGNHAQTCQVPCPTGNDTFSYTVPASTFFARTQAEADAEAVSYCFERALEARVCKPKAPAMDPPFVWWPMEEASGVRIDVIQGLGLIPAGGSEAQVTGKVGKAGSIPIPNFQNNYFGCSFASLPYTSGLSLVGWIKPELTTTRSDTEITFNGGFINMLHSFSTNQFDAQVFKGGNFQDIIAPGPGSSNTWTFFVFTYDAVTGKVGARINNGPYVESPAGVILGTLVNPTVKCLPYDNGISLDEFAIFTRKLTLAEMDILYKAGTGTTWPLTP